MVLINVQTFWSRSTFDCNFMLCLCLAHIFADTVDPLLCDPSDERLPYHTFLSRKATPPNVTTLVWYYWHSHESGTAEVNIFVLSLLNVCLPWPPHTSPASLTLHWHWLPHPRWPVETSLVFLHVTNFAMWWETCSCSYNAFILSIICLLCLNVFFIYLSQICFWIFFLAKH